MHKFFYGVIEGFYGRQWPWTDREDYAEFLSRQGFDCYIYAPKGDLLLRSAWRKQYSPAESQRLQLLGDTYRRKGVRWGLGFSPLGLSQAYNGRDKLQLQEKIRQLNGLGPDILCILFDDVRGDVEGLAERQLKIVEDVLAVSEAGQHIICPTYYSFDPVLERVFGKMPEAYWQTLGQHLSADVGIFWTGNKVIATEFSAADMQRAEQLLARKPIIWDNYPVNDGKLTSDHLHLRAYSGRPRQLAQWSAGHVVNPMNQPLLSQLVLQSLKSLYHSDISYCERRAFDDALGVLGDTGLAEQLAADVALFQDVGLAGMKQQQRTELSRCYQAFGHPLADEVADWLTGGYCFDPDCLTG